MAKQDFESGKKRTPETFWRWFRNVNALGAMALAGAGVYLPQYQGLLFTGASINAIEAGGGELMLQRSKRGSKTQKK